LPTPRGLSQAPTSFIGSWYLDIHRLPLVACHNKKSKIATKRCSRPLYSSQNTGRNTRPQTTTYQVNIHPRDNTPRTNTHTNGLVRAGPSHPPHQTQKGTQCGCDPEETVPNPQGTTVPVSRARFLRTQQRASASPHRLTRVPRTRSPKRTAAVLATSTRILA